MAMVNTRTLTSGLIAVLAGFSFHFSAPPGLAKAHAQAGIETGFGSSAGARGAGIGASSSADGVRPNMVKPLKLANELIKERKYQEALVKLQNLDDSTRARMSDKIPMGRSSYEEYALQKTRAIAAVGAGNLPLAARSFEAVIATGRLPAKDKLNLIETVVNLYYQDRNYMNCLEWGQRYLAEGGTSANVQMQVAGSHYHSENFAAAKSGLSEIIAGNSATGQIPAEELLVMLAESCQKLGDQGCHDDATQKLAAHYPKDKQPPRPDN